MRRRRLTGLVASAAVLLGACGSEGAPPIERSAAPTTTTADTTTTTTTTAPVVTTTTTTAAPAPEGDVVGTSAYTAPRPAKSAEELAARIATVEALVRDPATTGHALFAASFEQQVLYRQLARRPEWEPAVIGAIPEPYRHAAWANAAARREFRSMHSTLGDSLPAWRIVEPPPAEELLAHYQAAQAEFGVPWEILAAVNLVETGMGRIRGVSVAGAQGPMQFMPATWAAYGAGGDVNDPGDAIRGAARYLAANGGGSGDIDNALWNYNHSWKYVAGVKHYASVMKQDPSTFRGFHQWQIVYLSTMGDVWLPTGFETHQRVPVADHLVRNPWAHLGTATR
ncbi:MAG TPA: lytic transglycosylase domain-containing protein [Acidimicrobiales bacterium]|nr:lytic transglycosylase domain-containing protein [Acidimicrobiales bacterium]